MRNRETVEYLIYPRLYNAHSVLYKGTYCVCFTLYHLTLSKTTTYAFPFILPALSSSFPSLHTHGNFSFLTPKFDIVYEEERKSIDSQCIFRLQFDRNKEYQVLLSVKLLRRSTMVRPHEEGGLCMRQSTEAKMEVIDEQLLEVGRKGFHSYERVVFRASEFFSSIDFHLCTFIYGYKHFRSKLQLSSLFSGIDLAKNNANLRLRDKIENGEKHSRVQDALKLREQMLSDFESRLPEFYRDLEQLIDEHQRLLSQYNQTALTIPKDQQRNVMLPKPILQDLEYIRLKEKVSLRVLCEHFSVSTSEEILASIVQQKQLIRRNIRRLREQYCRLLPLQTEKQFIEKVVHHQEEIETAQERHFVRHVPDLTLLEGENQVRRQAVEKLKQERCVWNNRVNNAPLFYVQNHTPSGEKTRKPKNSSLTVFVHGYQGNSFDFQKAKNYLKKHNSHTHILIVESITNDMSQSIDSLGQQVAAEITNYIENSIFEFPIINFVGFSLGGLIARAALGRLQQYWNRLNLLATFSSPHLGISEGDNSLVNLGVWYLIKVDKVKNLKELNFQSVQFADSLLMRLSRCPGISHFKRVVLVCSKNDGFVPFYSTVLDPRKCQKKDITELCNNITSHIAHLQRVQMVFDVRNSGTFDKLTGRKGHIQFLDNDYFLQLFFRLYGPIM